VENRNRGSAAYYDIFTNNNLFTYLRRIVWGYLPYFSFNQEDEDDLDIYIDWRK
jgi:hypothetical protein